MPREMVIPEPSDDDLARINAVLRKIGGENVVWGSQNVLDVWAIEQRARQDAALSQRLLIASWALVVVTLGLVVATVGLIAAG